jgi:hypothetical protein
VLALLIDGDPLELEARCAERVRAQAILLELQELQLRTIAHVARHGPSYRDRGTPPFDVWLAEKVRKAVGELIEEQAQRAGAGAIPEVPRDAQLVAIAEALGIEPEALALGCVAFNRSPYEVRSAFFGIVVDQRSPSAWSQENGTTHERTKIALRRAFWALGVRDEADLDGLLREVDDGS